MTAEMCAFQGKLGGIWHVNKAKFWSQIFCLPLLVDFIFTSVVWFKSTFHRPRVEEYVDTREYQKL